MPPQVTIAPKRRILLCVGPGGVGKTTVAAAMALAAARAGKRVIVVTIDPSQRLAQALGLRDQVPGQITAVPMTGGSLDALLLDTRSVFDAIVGACSPTTEAAEAMLDNPIYLATVQRLGGSLEFAATARVQMLHAEGDYDLVVLDTPPTANAIEFLDAPAKIQDVVDNPAAKLLAGTGRLGMRILGLGGGVLLKTLQAIGGGPFVSDLGTFLREFGSVLGEFRKRSGDFDALMHSAETGVVLTTAATDFSLREAKDFVHALAERKLRVDAIVLNRVDSPAPPLPDDDVLRAAVGSDARLAAAHELHAGLTEQSERAAAAIRDLSATFSDTQVGTIERWDHPPTTLDDLTTMGLALVEF